MIPESFSVLHSPIQTSCSVFKCRFERLELERRWKSQCPQQQQLGVIRPLAGISNWAFKCKDLRVTDSCTPGISLSVLCMSLRPSCVVSPQQIWPIIDRGAAIYIVYYPLPLSHCHCPLSLCDLIFLFSLHWFHILPLLYSALKSSRLCSLLLRNANADYSILERLRPSGNNLTLKLPTWCEERWHQTDSPNTNAVGTAPKAFCTHRRSICYSLGDFFGDRVLHLESGVDFDEVVFAMFVHQEFHGASVLVAHLQHNTAQKATLSLLANTAGKKGGLNTEGVLAHPNEPWKTKHFLPALHNHNCW